MDCPIQVVGLLRLPQGQTFSQSSLINLNHFDTSSFKVLNLILDGQCNLVAGLRSNKIISFVFSAFTLKGNCDSRMG